MEKCSIKSLIKGVLRYKRELIAGNLFAILATVTIVIVPLFIPLLIDELLLKKGDTLTSFVDNYITPMSLVGYVLFFLILTIILRLGVIFATKQVKICSLSQKISL